MSDRGGDRNVGLVLGGKYRLARLLGEGGMGAVYEARHEFTGRRLAVKMLHAEYACDEEVVRRFQREARASAAIGHDHIIEVTDMGVTAGGDLFLVMEYLEGRDLASVLKSEGALGPERACRVMIQVLSALEAAHGHGIIHRDLKPANIFLSRHGETDDWVKLLDFGIAKVRATEEGLTRGLTRTGELLGTPAYMSPEQARGETTVTPATDIYSAGVILFETLTGILPFQSPSFAELLIKILTEEPPSPLAVRPGLPPSLAEIVLKALRKDPRDRFADATAFRRSLVPFAGSEWPADEALASVPAARSRPDPGPRSEAGGRRETVPLALVDTGRPARRGRMPIVVGALSVVAVALLGVVVFLLWGLDRDEGTGSATWTGSSALSTEPVPAGQGARHRETAVSLPGGAADRFAPPKRIRFEARVTPETAEILVDGRSVGRGNVTTDLVADGAEHEILFRAAGYAESRHRVIFERDVSIAARLERGATPRKDDRPDKAESAPRIGERDAQPVPVVVPATGAGSPEPAAQAAPAAGKSSRGTDRVIDDEVPW